MAVMVQEQQLSFARGMNDTAAPVEYKPDECELLQNGRVSFDGQTIERRGGSEKLHTTALNSGAQSFGAIEYHTAAGTQQLVVFMGDKMYTSINEGASWTQQATGLTEAFWSLVIMREVRPTCSVQRTVARIPISGTDPLGPRYRTSQTT